MRILMFNYFEVKSPGGIHKVILETSKNLSKKGHKVTVIQGNQMNLPDYEIYEGFEIIRIKSRIADHCYGLSPEIYTYLKKHFREMNPDIVHVHGYHTLFSLGVIYSIKKLNRNIPLIFSPHFAVFSRNTFAGKHLGGVYNRVLGQKIMDKSDFIITASEYESNSLKNFFKSIKYKTTVIPHGVDSINVTKVDSNNNEIKLLYVGYLLELKGVQYILEAVHYLYYKKNLNVSLTIIGKGPYHKVLKKIAKKLNVCQFIKWEDFIPPSQTKKLNEYYFKSDIVLLLSKSENYGIVVSEALAMGTPVIVTKRTALKEFLDEPGCFGVDYPPKSDEVSNLIIEIHGNNVKVGPFSRKVRYWNEVAMDYESIYNSMRN